MSGDAAHDQHDPLIGQIVQGRFKVLARLEAGGMGVVYRAEQIPLGRVVALKILESKNNAELDANFSRRFFLEASAAARLAHPNTIVVHDYGKTDAGQCFIAMEYLDGGSLSERLKQYGPLSPSEAIHVALQIAGSLRDAHAQGLVHRDLKPGNVMFAPRGGDPLFAKVLDFGLVKVVSGAQDARLTQSGVMMGSPRYMAPEQVRAQPVDHRADIYSFGAVLYHMVAGSPPFAAESAFEAMHAHVSKPPPALRETWAKCPAGPQLEATILRCLAKEPGSRFQSMDEVMAALRACEAEAGVTGGLRGGWGGSQAHLAGSSSAFALGPPMPAPVPPPVRPHDSDPASGSISNSGIAPAGSHGDHAAPRPYEKTMRFEGDDAPPPAAAPNAPAAVAPHAPPAIVPIAPGLATMPGPGPFPATPLAGGAQAASPHGVPAGPGSYGGASSLPVAPYAGGASSSAASPYSSGSNAGVASYAGGAPQLGFSPYAAAPSGAGAASFGGASPPAAAAYGGAPLQPSGSYPAAPPRPGPPGASHPGAVSPFAAHSSAPAGGPFGAAAYPGVVTPAPHGSSTGLPQLPAASHPALVAQPARPPSHAGIAAAPHAPLAGSQPALVAPRSNRGFWIAFALLAVAVVIGGGIAGAAFVVPRERSEAPTVAPPRPTTSAGTRSRSATVERPREAIDRRPQHAEAAPELRPLLLRTDPPGATVQRDGQDLGDTPVSLEIPRGEHWTIVVTLTGYEPRTVTVASGHPELTLHLSPSRRSAAPRVVVSPVVQPRPLVTTPVRPAVQRPTYQGGDLNDPWANRRR